MRYGLIGGRLGHSYSQPIHEALGGYPYELIELSGSRFDPFMQQRDFTAINVTIPYKQRVMAYCDTIDPGAQSIGAVNTIVNREGKLWGYNTDFAGLIYALEGHQVSLKDKKVMILGSGGTCQTIKAVAHHQGARQIVVVSRTPGPGVITYAQSAGEPGVEVILNASPVGMYPDVAGRPIDLADHPQCRAVADMIYNPLRTRLLQQAEKMGMMAFNGLKMLVAQAKFASEIFIHQSIDDGEIDRIYQALRDKLTNIVLIGMPSAGKTAIGSLLAERFTKPLVDIDDLIRQRAGRDIPGIFAQWGEGHFRGLEADCVRDAAVKTGQIIATGGGVIKDAANIASLRQNGLLFFIDRAPGKLISDETRPLSSSPEAVKQLYQERYPLYRGYGDATIDNNGTPEEAADRIEERYHEIIGD